MHDVEGMKNVDMRTKRKKPPKDRVDLSASCDIVM